MTRAPLNSAAIRYYADYIETLPLDSVATDLAGHIARAAPEGPCELHQEMATATRALGMEPNADAALDLFCSFTDPRATPKDVARVMRDLAKTGKANWAPVRNRIEVGAILKQFTECRLAPLSEAKLSFLADLNLSATRAALRALVANREATFGKGGYTAT